LFASLIYSSAAQVHYPGANGLKIVLHFKVSEGNILWEDFFRLFSQLGDVPFSVAKLIYIITAPSVYCNITKPEPGQTISC
jgi:hypothetical protein